MTDLPSFGKKPQIRAWLYPSNSIGKKESTFLKNGSGIFICLKKRHLKSKNKILREVAEELFKKDSLYISFSVPYDATNRMSILRAAHSKIQESKNSVHDPDLI